jgi:hypothetical protein
LAAEVAADFPEAAAGSPEGVVVEVVTLPETTAAATLPETTAAAEKAATPPPALDPTGPCNNAADAADDARDKRERAADKRKRERQKNIKQTRVD